MFVQGRRAAAAAALALAALAGLTACSNGGDPATLPPLSTTPTASTTTAPTFDQKTALAQASAVVREYFRAKNALGAHMDANALAALVTPSCACRTLVAESRRLAAKHRHYFGRAAVRAITPALDNAQLAEVLVAYDSTPGGTKDEAGHVIYQGPAHLGVKQLFYVTLTRDRWLIADIKLVKSGTTQ